jgi:hypothetical protein
VPDVNEHRAKAVRNRAFLGTIAEAVYPEWTVVAAFYAALHSVERLAASESYHPPNHAARINYIRYHARHRAILRPYLALYFAGMVARYESINLFHSQYPTPVAGSVLPADELAAVENYVATELAPSRPTSPAN